MRTSGTILTVASWLSILIACETISNAAPASDHQSVADPSATRKEDLKKKFNRLLKVGLKTKTVTKDAQKLLDAKFDVAIDELEKEEFDSRKTARALKNLDTLSKALLKNSGDAKSIDAKNVTETFRIKATNATGICPLYPFCK